MNQSITLKPSQIENEALASAVRAQFDDEFEACRLALSTAATAYCEAAIPAEVRMAHEVVHPYLHRSVTARFTDGGEPVCLSDGCGVFYPVHQIPLGEPMVMPRDRLIAIDREVKESLPLVSAIAAMGELLAQVMDTYRKLATQSACGVAR